MRRTAIELYQRAFGARPRAVASAPGRLNLIGEQTDANGGPVLPIAVADRAVVAVGPAEGETVEAVAASDGAVVRFQWKDALPRGWAATLGGLQRELWTLGARRAGVRVAVASAVPTDLAPSAALAVAAARALSALTGVRLAPRQLAGVAYRADDQQAGARGSVMDYTVAVLARPGRALLLECASLATRHVPFTGRLLLVDTGAQADVAERALAARRAECAAAVERLKVDLPELVWLASWPVEWLYRLKKALPEPERSRAVHVVSEAARARYAAQLLERRRVREFGRLLDESHESCRRLYECSAPELDLAVAAARRGGALGARLAGGWGRSVIVLVGGGRERGIRAREGRIVAAVGRAFRRAYDREPRITPVAPSRGVRLERA